MTCLTTHNIILQASATEEKFQSAYNPIVMALQHPHLLSSLPEGGFQAVARMATAIRRASSLHKNKMNKYILFVFIPDFMSNLFIYII